MKQNKQQNKDKKQLRKTDSRNTACRCDLSWPFKLIFGLLLATLIITAIVVCVRLNLESERGKMADDWRVSYYELKEYAVCDDGNVNEGTGGATDNVRCLNDDDIAIIREANYDPMTNDEADGKLVKDEQGDGHIDVNNARDLKRFLDYSLSTNSSVMSSYPVATQLASTITDDGSDYIYTFYVNRPIGAACYYSCPKGLSCIVQPSYEVEVGGQCDQPEGGAYRESRGLTIVGELKINKDDMEVKLNKAGTNLDVDDNYIVTLVHDADHNLDYLGYDDGQINK